MGQLKPKDSYEDLTENQQRVVDELADDPTAQNTEIADRAGVSRSTVTNVKSEYGEIIESRLNQRGRYDGDAETTDALFEDLPEERHPSYFQNRSVPKSTTADDDESDVTVLVELDATAVRDVLENGDVSRVRGRVVDALMQQAFET